MGGNEETNKLTSLSDSSSSSSQPLLSKLNFSPTDPTHSGQPESDPAQYLQVSYNYGPRPVKDVAFLIVFAFLVLCTFGLGIFAVLHRNPDFFDFSSYTYDSNSTSCVKDSTFSSKGGFFDPLLFDRLLGSSSDGSFLKALIWLPVNTWILSVTFSFLLLLSLRHYTKQLVYASLPVFVVVPVLFDVYLFVACTVSSSCSDAFPLVYRILVLVTVLLVVGIIVWIVVANWHKIELTVMIIGVASDALFKNLGLFIALPLLTLGLVVFLVPIVVFLVFAAMNGKIVPRESSGAYTCAWKPDSWVSSYYTLAILTMLWSLTAMVEAKAYVISGTIAQWYFSKEDSHPKRSLRSSLRNAFGPSSGTVCLSGLLICAVRLVRTAVGSARREDIPGMVNPVSQGCFNVILSAVDFLNKFTINFAAITGEAYLTSAKTTYELLKRNLLSAVFVDIISARLLAGIIFVLSAIYAIVVFAILKGVSNLGVDSYFVAVLAWLLLIAVLRYFVHVLDNVIDTVYVCYAIDRDRGDVYKQEMHEVYVHLLINKSNDTP